MPRPLEVGEAINAEVVGEMPMLTAPNVGLNEPSVRMAAPETKSELTKVGPRGLASGDAANGASAALAGWASARLNPIMVANVRILVSKTRNTAQNWQCHIRGSSGRPPEGTKFVIL